MPQSAQLTVLQSFLQGGGFDILKISLQLQRMLLFSVDWHVVICKVTRELQIVYFSPSFSSIIITARDKYLPSGAGDDHPSPLIPSFPISARLLI